MYYIIIYDNFFSLTLTGFIVIYECNVYCECLSQRKRAYNLSFSHNKSIYISWLILTLSGQRLISKQCQVPLYLKLKE